VGVLPVHQVLQVAIIHPAAVVDLLPLEVAAVDLLLREVAVAVLLPEVADAVPDNSIYSRYYFYYET
jgi:hypothetical protein